MRFAGSACCACCCLLTVGVLAHQAAAQSDEATVSMQLHLLLPAPTRVLIHQAAVPSAEAAASMQLHFLLL
jgi:hypothetical protein